MVLKTFLYEPKLANKSSLISALYMLNILFKLRSPYKYLFVVILVILNQSINIVYSRPIIDLHIVMKVNSATHD